ncbi:MAG TPA: TetR/AcrR family transcriptional regulator [Alphaproteobacteria bacterium]|nr:TetR/AcrR family transcriptional regulator [Alphaproteobacteria bacterium]
MAVQGSASADKPGGAAKRREEIVAEASRLFLEKGFQSTTMRELARALDLDAGSLYRYFPSKGSLFATMAQDANENIARSLRAAIDQASAGDNTVRLAFSHYVHLVDRYSEYYRLFYRCFDGLPRELWQTLLDSERGIVQVFLRLLEDQGYAAGDAATLAWDVTVLGEMWAIKRWAFHPSMDIEGYIAVQWRAIAAMLAAFKRAGNKERDLIEVGS